MPRPARVKHPIRDLRAIIGRTQYQFAEDIGVSAIWLKKLENMPPSDLPVQTARKVYLETGADAAQLREGKLCTYRGEEYTADFYKKEWKRRRTIQNPEMAREFARDIACWTDILLRASVLRRGKLWQVRESLVEALNDACAAFQLGPLVEDILKREDPEHFAEAPEKPITPGSKASRRRRAAYRAAVRYASGWYPQGSAPAKLLRELFPADVKVELAGVAAKSAVGAVEIKRRKRRSSRAPARA